MNNASFTPVFKVFKLGTTTKGPVTILKKDGEPFNEEFKRSKYLALGYTITENNSPQEHH